MKNIDFTQTGGFPLTQDQLGFMQTAWQEVVNAFLNVGVCNSAPMILTGMQLGTTTVGGLVTGDISDGWFVYQGKAIHMPYQTYSILLAAGEALYVVLTPTAGSLIYNDGLTHTDVIQDVTASLQVLPTTTATDSTHFPFSLLTPFGREASYTEVTFTIPGPGTESTYGNFYYKKNYLNNTLDGYITFTANNPSSFVSGTYFNLVTVATLPVGYRPLRGPVYFTGTTNIVVSYGYSGGGYFNTITGFINTDGTVNLYLLYSLPSTYGGNISFIVSLD